MRYCCTASRELTCFFVSSWFAAFKGGLVRKELCIWLQQKKIIRTVAESYHYKLNWTGTIQGRKDNQENNSYGILPRPISEQLVYSLGIFIEQAVCAVQSCVIGDENIRIVQGTKRFQQGPSRCNTDLAHMASLRTPPP